MINNLAVSVRAYNERTKDLCSRIVHNQVQSKKVNSVHETPFSNAVKKTFEIGISHNCKYTLAIDADVLLKKDAITELLSNVESLPEKIKNKLFVYQGNVLCKVFGKPRQAGFHLYKTSLLPKALQYLEQTKDKIRPESSIYKIMINEGYYHYIDDQIYGLHDYEQYYKDNFRNGFFQSKKHLNQAGELLTYWTKNMSKDLDFKAMIFGWLHGSQTQENIKVDFYYFEDIIQKYFPNLDLEEKEEYTNFELEDIYKMIEKELNQNQFKLKIRLNKIPSFKERLLNKCEIQLHRIIENTFSILR